MSLSPSMTTFFAPPERAVSKDVDRQYRYFASLTHLTEFLDATPIIFVVLNAQRQVVYANRALMDALGLEDRAAANGRRPGELLGCVHARENESGCGTTEFCRTCGAVKTILSSLRGSKSIDECRMTQADGTALDLRVSGSPLVANGEHFSLFAVEDISHEKRRLVLERLFFHDVLNLAGVVMGAAHLLNDEPVANAHIEDLRSMLIDSVELMVDTLKTQRDLSIAESGDLAVRMRQVSSLEMLVSFVRDCTVMPAANNRSIVIDPDSDDVLFETDFHLLERVAENLIKNALEASDPGETVTVSCVADGDFVSFLVHNSAVMPPEVQLQMFQRSFSTKGQGRGLGTYSVKLLSERYLRGTVMFTSMPGSGTTFVVTYPRQYPTELVS